MIGSFPHILEFYIKGRNAVYNAYDTPFSALF